MLLRVLFDAHSDNGRTTEYKSKRKHKTRAIDFYAHAFTGETYVRQRNEKRKKCVNKR